MSRQDTFFEWLLKQSHREDMVGVFSSSIEENSEYFDEEMKSTEDVHLCKSKWNEFIQEYPDLFPPFEYFEEAFEEYLIKKQLVKLEKCIVCNKNKIFGNKCFYCRTQKKKYIYFIQSYDGAVKIGITDDVSRRLKQGQTWHHTKLRVVKLIENASLKKERELHERFSEYRLDNDGGDEWFTEEVLDFI